LVSPLIGASYLSHRATQRYPHHPNASMVVVVGINDTSVYIECLGAEVWNQATSSHNTDYLAVNYLFIFILAIVLLGTAHLS
jgi:hypothetical protein